MKKFGLDGSEIVRLVHGMGGCVASNRITVDGQDVGYMYREDPVNPQDSGWRFLSGSEDAAYMANLEHHRVYDVNTIANYDPAILPYLDAPVGSEFERSKHTNSFVEIRRRN